MSVKKESGFSILEVMIAGALMIALAFAAYQLLTATTKSTGDLEKRLRHHDLVDDIRFLFFTPSQCSVNFPRDAFREGAEVSLRLAGDTTIAKDVTLTEYGLKVLHFTFKNVMSYPEVHQVLIGQSGRAQGEYQEHAETGDLVLEAQLMGSTHPQKPMNVVRITVVKRSGFLNEEYCFGNHDAPGRSVGGGGGEGAEFPTAGSSGGSGAGTYGHITSEVPGAQPGKVARDPKPSGVYVAAAECFLHDADAKTATGKARLIDGETVKFSRFPGQTTKLKCVGGQLEESTE